MLLESRVEFFYHTFVSDVIMDGERIDSVVISNKDGISVIQPQIVIDCTGDADVAAWAGAPYEIAEQVQAGTMMFTAGGVKYEKLQDTSDACKAAMEKSYARGKFKIIVGLQ